MLGCGELPHVALGPADVLLDRAWLALQRGDEQGLAEVVTAAAAIGLDPLLAERLERDLNWQREGRAATLVSALDDDSPWAGRYLASAEAAREWLDRHPVVERGVWCLERARRTEDLGRRRRLAQEALWGSSQQAEALALWIETEQAAGALGLAGELLAQAPDTARLAWARRRQDLSCGRTLSAAAGLTADLESGRITPRGLVTLGALLVALPDVGLEARVLAALDAQPLRGDTVQPEARRLRALLLARQGAFEAALALRPRDSVDDMRLVASWSARQRAAAPGSVQTSAGAEEGRAAAGLAPSASAGGSAFSAGPEALVEADRLRADGADVAYLALLREWDLAARASYRASAAGAGPDLDEFLTALDDAAAGLPGAPRLADLPRREFGLLGTLLDPTPLEALAPGAFLLGGQGLFQPPELTLYDLLDRETRRVGEVAWVEHHVVRQRVPGFVASRGGVFTGAGIVDRVFLDLELVDEQVRRLATLTPAAELAPRAATDTAARRSLAEPLDVARALRAAALAEVGDDLAAHVLEGLSLHEGQHILDAQAFLGHGVLGRLGMLLEGGLVPASVRAALERRAQLRALRQAAEPRLVLADCVDVLPVEGAALNSEHAVGYASLLEDLIEVLDRGDWEGARPLEQLGLDRDANLLQQLPRLDVATLRALARALPD